MLQWIDERLGIKKSLTLPIIPRGRARWQYFPGFFTFVLLFFLLFTGLIIACDYSPKGALSAQSYTKGYIVRCHAVAAQFLVAFISLYFVRNLLTGAYQRPRELNWLTFCVLFILSWIAFYVGTILDGGTGAQNNLQTFVAVCEQVPLFGSYTIKILGMDKQLTEDSLQRLFISHSLILPAGIYSAMFAYFWLLEKIGFVSSKKKHRSGR